MSQDQQDCLPLCKFCNRKLKTQSSIERGCGLSCAKKNNVLLPKITKVEKIVDDRQKLIGEWI